MGLQCRHLRAVTRVLRRCLAAPSHGAAQPPAAHHTLHRPRFANPQPFVYLRRHLLLLPPHAVPKPAPPPSLNRYESPAPLQHQSPPPHLEVSSVAATIALGDTVQLHRHAPSAATALPVLSCSLLRATLPSPRYFCRSTAATRYLLQCHCRIISVAAPPLRSQLRSCRCASLPALAPPPRYSITALPTASLF